MATSSWIIPTLLYILQLRNTISLLSYESPPLSLLEKKYAPFSSLA